jgi:hypothetical protein
MESESLRLALFVLSLTLRRATIFSASRPTPFYGAGVVAFWNSRLSVLWCYLGVTHNILLLFVRLKTFFYYLCSRHIEQTNMLRV